MGPQPQVADTVCGMSSILILWLTLAADLTPEKAAAMNRALEKSASEIEAKYGNRKQQELSYAERSQKVKDLSAAEKSVLEKNDVSANEWIRYSANMGRGARADMVSAKKQQDEAEKSAAAKKSEAQEKSSKTAETPIQIVETKPEGPKAEGGAENSDEPGIKVEGTGAPTDSKSPKGPKSETPRSKRSGSKRR
jgi:hypothetical protein